MGWVLDSSMALAWVFPDKKSGEAERLLSRRAAPEELWVPALWWYEIANALVSARRRRRITQAEAARAAELFGELPLKTDAVSEPSGLNRLGGLASEHGLSAYDCAYLELAQRKGFVLATLDGRLAAAAVKSGVRALP